MSSHILIVEDEKHLGVGIKYNLAAEGHRVTLVEDGTTALRMLKNDPSAYDLIVLDLMLPGMSGYAVCEAIRDGGLNTPVLMLSARTLAEDRTRGFEVGANQYMSKPFELDELIARVNNLLSIRTSPSGGTGERSGANGGTAAPTAASPRTAEFGRVEVDFEAHRATVDGESVRMTAKELRLLRYFVANEGRVISRGELLREVWEMSGNLQTRAVDNFIARLRKIIEDDSTSPRHLLTIRDAGYRFTTEPE